ncbi:ATP-binding cassette domain-containing protein, partial [Actinomyces slackii]
RANAAAFTLTLLGALATCWALISTGRALGALVAQGSPTPFLLQALAAAGAAGACQAACQMIARSSASAEEAHLRRLGLTHLLALGPARATDLRTGATVSLLADGVERIALYRQTFLAPTAAAAAAPLAGLALLALAADHVTAAVLAGAVIAVPAVIAVAHMAMRSPSSESRRARSRLAAEYLDAIQGLTTLTLARAARLTRERLSEAGQDNRRAVMSLLAGNQLVILITDGLFSLLVITMAAGLALHRLGTGAIGPGDALAIVLVSYALLEPLHHVGAFFYVGMGGMANQRALRRLLSRPLAGTAPTGQEMTESGPAPEEDSAESMSESGMPDEPDAPDAAPPTCPRAEVLLESVEATWEPEGPAVVQEVDLRVEHGEHVAVIGPSGSGKSTLVALLSGDLLPASGAVRVAGTELTAATQDTVRAASALVSQSTWLFTGTIADNLLLARPGATHDQMWQALESANLDREVALMPQGLDTPVGEAGMGLSGGQAQRLSLARAVLADRPLLLLDEPTSQVDLASEAAIVEAVERLSGTRTIVTVSHRAGALSRADRTVRVSQGRVTEEAS